MKAIPRPKSGNPARRTTAKTPRRVPGSWILLAAIGLIALNMRGPLVAVAPVVGPMRHDLGFSPAELGYLTGIPVLCFALAAPLAALAARKLGPEFAITMTLLGVLLGVAVRSAGGGAVVILGTVILGLAITVGNIVVPLIIRRDFAPARQGAAMGIYTAALNIGSFITSMVMAPVAEALGWRLALASCGLLAVAAAVFWALAVRRRAFIPAAAPEVDPAKPAGKAASRWITAGLTAAFAGQAFSYYGVTAWLPSLLADELGMAPAAAGAGSSLFQILAIVGGLGVPFVARYISTTTAGLALGALWLTVPAGLLLVPELWWAWSSLGGIAQGGGITLVFIAIIKLARDQASAGRMSAVVQGSGYCFGAAAPTLLGYVHGVTGSWTGPLLIILGSAGVFTLGAALSLRHVPKQH